ncbi:MAG: class I SAM-dependent methyltransferase [Oligoflexales bacterium]
MFSKLININKRPTAFEFYTTKTLWTEDYISKKMLEIHLDSSTDLATRKPEFVRKSVDWMVRYFSIGKDFRICDFGCGPGLYTTPLAQVGAKVTGVDFSKRSINYANKVAAKEKLDIEYIHSDYLKYSSNRKFDLVTLIFNDFCVLSPQKRKEMFKVFKEHLAPGGSLLLDVCSLELFNQAKESVNYEFSQKDGFWSNNPYFEFQNTFKYDKEKVLLYKHTIINDKSKREIFNWLQCYDLASLENEFQENGFTIMELFSNVCGAPLGDESVDIAVVAKLQ